MPSDENGVEIHVGSRIKWDPQDGSRPITRRVLAFENGWPCVRVNGLDEAWDPTVVTVVS